MKWKWGLLLLAYIAGLLLGLYVWHCIAQFIGAVDLIGMLKEAL